MSDSVGHFSESKESEENHCLPGLCETEASVWMECFASRCLVRHAVCVPTASRRAPDGFSGRFQCA